MTSMWDAASSDDYFYGSASDGCPPDDGADEEPVEDTEEPPPAPEQGETLAAEVIRKLRAAGLRGTLADARRAPGQKGDLATAMVVRVKLARAETRERAVAALDGLVCVPHPRIRGALYVARPPRSTAERVVFALTARADLAEGIDFVVDDPRRPGTALHVRLTPQSLFPSTRRNMMGAAMEAIVAAGLTFDRGVGQLDLLVSEKDA